MDKIADLIEAEEKYREILKDCIQEAPEIFRTVRQQLGLSQRDLAKRLGYNHTYISKIENRRLVVGKPILAKLGELMRQNKAN